jgi:hypothetical protein
MDSGGKTPYVGKIVDGEETEETRLRSVSKWAQGRRSRESRGNVDTSAGSVETSSVPET